jgi:hypothetical protein
MRRLIALTAVLTGACFPDRREVGVDVFSNDTLPARFTMEVTGNLQMNLRMSRAIPRPDHTLIFETPGSMVVQNGAGTATITSIDSLRRIAVQPIGTPIDSTETMGVVGRVVKIERKGEEKRVKISVQRP